MQKLIFLPFLKWRKMCFCTFEIALFSNFRALWVIFYAEMMRKVDLWFFFHDVTSILKPCETVKKMCKSTFRIKSSVYNIISLLVVVYISHWFQMAFRVQFNFPRFPQLLAGLNNDFRVGHDVGNPQKWTLMNPSANMGSSLDTANLFTSKNWKMCTTEIGL